MHSRHKAASTKKRPEAFWVYEETGLPHPFAELAATGRRLARWSLKCKPRGEWGKLETNYRLQTSKKSSKTGRDAAHVLRLEIELEAENFLCLDRTK